MRGQREPAGEGFGAQVPLRDECFDTGPLWAFGFSCLGGWDLGEHGSEDGELTAEFQGRDGDAGAPEGGPR